MVTYRIDRINKEFLRLYLRCSSRIKRGVSEAILTKVNASKDLSYARSLHPHRHIPTRRDPGCPDSVAGQIRSMLGRDAPSHNTGTSLHIR